MAPIVSKLKPAKEGYHKVALSCEGFSLYTTEKYQGVFRTNGKEFSQIVVHNVNTKEKTDSVAAFVKKCKQLHSVETKNEMVYYPSNMKFIILRPDDRMCVDAPNTIEWYMINEREFATKDAFLIMSSKTCKAPDEKVSSPISSCDKILGTMYEREIMGTPVVSKDPMFQKHVFAQLKLEKMYLKIAPQYPERYPSEIFLVWREVKLLRGIFQPKQKVYDLRPCESEMAKTIWHASKQDINHLRGMYLLSNAPVKSIFWSSGYEMKTYPVFEYDLSRFQLATKTLDLGENFICQNIDGDNVNMFDHTFKENDNGTFTFEKITCCLPKITIRYIV